ncbi:uncharacterized protein si:dkeyp-97b10.3 isoform X2 [Pungitius pungitius]|uniref:uncharacterized protein si:dkeyp-97b10.3 isoform X2 n=1 Tax=Pungitius pungitius TaxID=134920 RepID=UPI002E14D6AB
MRVFKSMVSLNCLCSAVTEATHFVVVMCCVKNEKTVFSFYVYYGKGDYREVQGRPSPESTALSSRCVRSGAGRRESTTSGGPLTHGRMVAKMESCGAACLPEDGERDIPPTLEKKDNLIESDSSSSENTGTSTEESSEEEDEDEDEEEDGDTGCAQEGGGHEENAEESKNDLVPGTESDLSNGSDEMIFKLCCEKCKATQQSHGNELVTPRRISKGRFQVQLEGEGTYRCSVTGLVFEASERVLVRYSVLSWSKFSNFLGDSWRFAGPIFNVDTVNKEASALASIQFPHSICISDPENKTSFSVLHMKDNRPLIEPTVDHSGSHVKWNVTSLSPVGPIIPLSPARERHGVVLVYWLSSNGSSSSNNNNNKFHIFLAPNSSSEIQDIRKQVRGHRNRCERIVKPPQCLLNEGTYRLLSEPEGEIKPQDLTFTFAVTQMKGFFEAFFEEPPPFKLSLVEVETETTVWSSTIREEDCVIKTEKREERKRSDSRKRKSSPEEQRDPKRTRWQDESDAVKTRTWLQDMTEKQLLQLAKQLGKEWKQVGIFIDLTSKEVDDIKEAEPDVTMQKHKMLVTWKNRRQPGKATAYDLFQSVKNLDELSNEFHQILNEMITNPEAI